MNRHFPLKKNIAAFSAVIGVILMVMITIAIAATIYYYVNNFSTPYPPVKVFFAVDRATNGLYVVTGDPTAEWNDLGFRVNGVKMTVDKTGPVYAGDSVSMMPLLSENGYTLKSGGSFDVTILDVTHNAIIEKLTLFGTPEKVADPEPPAEPANGCSLEFTGDVYPTNNSVDVPIDAPSSITLRAKVCDCEDSLITVTFYGWSNGEVMTIGTQENVHSDEYASVQWSVISPETTYQWYTIADDGKNTVLSTVQSPTWQFTTATAHENQPPIIFNPNPSNGAGNQELSFTWSCQIEDPEGDLMTYSIVCSNGQAFRDDHAIRTYPNGTYSLDLDNLSYGTVYTVLVSASDQGSLGETTETYTFTTQAELTPPPAVTLSATLASQTSIRVVWTQYTGLNFVRYEVQYTTDNTWKAYNSKPVVIKTTTSYNILSLNPATTYYIRINTVVSSGYNPLSVYSNVIIYNTL